MPERRAHSNPQPKQKARRKVPADGSSSSQRSIIHAVVQKEGDFYTVECLEVAVVTQGETLDEAVDNLHEALCLHLEDEDLPSLGLTPEPRVEIIYDMGLACPA